MQDDKAKNYVCQTNRDTTTIATIRMVRIALCGCLLWVGQVALSALPNVELVTLLIAQFTLAWKSDVKYMCLVYVAICGLLWGVGLWLLSYIVVWLLWWRIVVILQKRFCPLPNLMLAICAGIFGVCFGIFFALPYAVADPTYALSFWISGIVWDVVHGIFNFIIMLILGKPLRKLLEMINRSMPNKF